MHCELLTRTIDAYKLPDVQNPGTIFYSTNGLLDTNEEQSHSEATRQNRTVTSTTGNTYFMYISDGKFCLHLAKIHASI